MSGTNGVLDGVNGAARRATLTPLPTLADYHRIEAENEELAKLADRRGEEIVRAAVDHETLTTENFRLAAELATVQAECCRLTDVNGDLAKLADAVWGVVDGWEYALANGLRANLEFGSHNGQALWRAYNGLAVKPAVDLTEDDVIDPSFEPAYSPRLTEAIKRLDAKWSGTQRVSMFDEEISDVLEAWGDKGEDTTATTATPQPTEPVNARLLAAAMAVQASWGKQIGEGHYGTGWTGVDDSALSELHEAILAAQGEGETAEPAANGVNASDIIREQSERIRVLENEVADYRLDLDEHEKWLTDGREKTDMLEAERDAAVAHADEARHIVRVQDETIGQQAGLIESLSKVEAAAREIRAEYATIPRDGWRMHAAYNALDFALDGLGKGEAAPCQAPKPAPCATPCAAQSPCPERVHMLAVAARNLILANRQGRLTQCEINTLDFALDGLI